MAEESFVITRADGSEIVVSGYVPGYATENYEVYEPGELADGKLPRKVDLRKYMTEVENQAAANSCTANGVAGAYEYLAKRHLGEESFDVSRLFIYYNARKRRVGEDEDVEDEGSSIFDSIKGLEEFGACSEATWPYDIENVNEEPSEEAYEEASEFLVEDFSYVPTNLDIWKHCLAEGNPIIFGTLTFQTFSSHRKRGLVPMPTKQDAIRNKHGRHIMLCVGYSDNEEVFIVRNSWGKDWGDGGYCYIPYDYLMNEKYNFNDSWIINRLDDIPVDEEIWDDEEDSSVLGDYETELDDMSDEDYADMLDDMGEYPLEYRIALIILHAAWSDDDFSEEEYEAMSEYLDATLEKLGSDYSAKKILKFCSKNADNEELLEESVELLGEYLSKAMLAKITQDVKEIISSDSLSEDEEEFLDYLVEEWQINDDDDDEDEDE
ncbi:MAG: C1 family peptidase [Leptospiraceae bacterium]|nr:C1 family peptidase [Leptospiraceae bacterium]